MLRLPVFTILGCFHGGGMHPDRPSDGQPNVVKNDAVTEPVQDILL
jgi:hypothetical protein